MSTRIKNTLFITTALTSALLLSGCEQSSAGDHLASAKEYIANNDNNAAIIELKNAIQRDELAVEPRLLLGQIYLETGDFLKAQHEFKQARTNGSDPTVLVPLLARSYLATEDTLNTIDVVDDSDITLPAIKSELLAMKSLALMLLDEYEEANDVLGQAQNLTSDGLYYQLAKGKMLSYEQKLEESVALVKQAAENHPTNSDAWLMLGHTYTAERNFELAAAAYQKAIDLTPMAVHYKLHQARALVLDSQFEKARVNIDELLAYSPENGLLNELNAITLYSEQKVVEAGDAARIALSKGSRNLRLRLIAGVADMENKDYESALNQFGYVLPYLNSDHYVNRLYAVALAEIGEVDKAEQFLTQLASNSQQHNDFIIDMSREFQKMGRSDITEALIASDATNNLSQRGKTQLALMKISQQDETGVEELQTLIAGEPKLSDTNQAIVYYYLAANDFTQAEAASEKWMADDANSTKALLVRAVVAQRQDQLDTAIEYIDRAFKIEPDNLNAHLLLVDIMRAQGKTEQTFETLKELAKAHPNNANVAKSLFITASELGKSDEVLQVYQGLNEETDNRLMLARAYAAAGDPLKAIELIESIPANLTSPTSFSLLSRLYVSQGNYKQAEIAAVKWLEIVPNNRDAMDQLIGLYERNGKYGSAIEVIEAAERRYPDAPSYTTAKARMYATQGKFTVALNAIDSREDWTGAEISRDWALAQIHTERKHFDQAVPLFESIYERSPNTRTTLALARTYQSLEEYDKATEILNNMIDKKINGYQSLELMLAQIQLQQDPNSALNQYQAILERDPDNLVALNNLAWVYLDNQQTDLACEYAQKAYDMAQQLPQVQDTYGYCLLKQGDIEQGSALIQKAYQQMPNEEEVILHYAESLIMTNRFAESRAILKKVNTTDKRLLALKQEIESRLE